MKMRLAFGAIVLLLGSVSLGAQPTAPPALPSDSERLAALLLRIEDMLRGGSPDAYAALISPLADPEPAMAFSALEVYPNATRAVVKERDRQALEDGTAFRLMIDTFVEFGNRARVATWQIEVPRTDESEWRISDQARLSSVDNLYRLTIDDTRQYRVRDLVVRAEDIDITLEEGSAFAVNAGTDVTGLVLIGRGTMRFRPTPETERAQVKIFAGSETLESSFEAAYIRTGTLESNLDRKQLVSGPVDQRDLRRARDVFRDESVKTYVLDLGDLSPTPWSLLPAFGDFLAEVRTRRFGTLTYVHAAAEPEDIFVMDRSREINISVYSSQKRIEQRGRFYGENDTDRYDVLDYDVDITYLPDRLWIDGRARLRIRTRTALGGQINVKLSDQFYVRSVSSDRFGRLFHLRARGMNVVVVHIPEAVPIGTELNITVSYAGRLEPQLSEREGIWMSGEGEQFIPAPLMNTGEASYLYSNRSLWYPQSPVANYATASIRVSVPDNLTCLASGEPLPGFPRVIGGQDGTPRRRLYAFRASRPIRYLSFVVSRLMTVDRTTVTFDEGEKLDESSYENLRVFVDANPLQVQRGRLIAPRVESIAKFYRSLVNDSPYGSFSTAVLENDRPGGHSPGYFATLNNPPPEAPIIWRNDPVNFPGYPEFFLAHELAHQWWGQGVGWNSYHEQWLSEGIANYFAALYAEYQHGSEQFGRMLRQMRNTALQYSEQGPVFLGYRIGHVKDDGRIFRALVYNKGALVMHMLRRFLGDEVFFRGVRRFYADGRYRKTSTEELRAAMEAESGRDLARFFERWIYGWTVPQLQFGYRVEDSSDGQEAVLRITQTGEIFDVPVTIRLQYQDGRVSDVVIPVAEQTVDFRVKLEGRLRAATVNENDGTVAEIRRVSY